ncbi:restriction endonuclease subunit S [Prevotella melaninogenica]|uniref:restriction endonuclease subunit S n=1 Tax=Prevotella melaninogenica TaxID=28132 RepID=UPI001C5FF906|nr:restriction endonuclease subunit S [Prevotella melaninogenica]MBW4900616.1 restriction endonuclease subunit S [Prevotella melaninogenica]
MRKEWELRKIGECFSYIKNGANIKQTKGAGGYPITRIETLSGGVFNRDRLGYADVVDLEQYKDYILESGDLLVSHINSKTYIGRTVVYEGKQGENIIHGMNLLRLKHNRSLINSEFLCYYTQSVSFKLDIMRIRKDAVNQSSFAISDFKKIKIPVPVLATQLSIVSELDKLNELIQIKKEQLKDYDALAQSIFYEMFGDPVENEKGWEVKKLGEVSTYPKERIAINQICPNQYIGVENLIKDRGGVRFSDNLPKADVAIAYKENDILLGNIRPYLKKIWLADKVGGASGDVIIIRIKERSISPLFLFKLLSSDQFFEYDNTHTKGAKMPRGDRKIIAKFGVILPPLSLQQSFAHKIEQIERQKAEVQKTITDLETLLAARMQYWFD